MERRCASGLDRHERATDGVRAANQRYFVEPGIGQHQQLLNTN
jgi:hypothetical protein